MVTHRFIKQAIYAVSFFLMMSLVLAFLIISVIQINPHPGPLPTPAVAFAPLVVEEVNFIQHAHSVDAVARIRNPNVQAGVAELPVKFIFTNAKGESMTESTVTTYILPGSLQYAVVLQVPVPANVTQVRTELPASPTFSAVPANIDLPNFGSFLRERTSLMVGGLPLEQQTGIVRNNSTFDFARVEIITLALDGQGKVVGIGQTFAGELRVGEQREFTVQWPQPATATQRIIISPTTNTFKSDNIIRAIGDPSLLR